MYSFNCVLYQSAEATVTLGSLYLNGRELAYFKTWSYELVYVYILWTLKGDGLVRRLIQAVSDQDNTKTRQEYMHKMMIEHNDTSIQRRTPRK